MRLGVGAGPTDVLAAGIGDLIAMATGAGGGRTIAGVISSHDPVPIGRTILSGLDCFGSGLIPHAPAMA